MTIQIKVGHTVEIYRGARSGHTFCFSGLRHAIAFQTIEFAAPVTYWQSYAHLTIGDCTEVIVEEIFKIDGIIPIIKFESKEKPDWMNAYPDLKNKPFYLWTSDYRIKMER